MNSAEGEPYGARTAFLNAVLFPCQPASARLHALRIDLPDLSTALAPAGPRLNPILGLLNAAARS